MNRRHLTNDKSVKGGSVAIILTSQVLNAVPLPIRKQADGLFIFPTKNVKELNAISEEFLGHLNKKQIKQVFNYTFDEPHNFLFIKPNHKKVLYKNFNLLNII